MTFLKASIFACSAALSLFGSAFAQQQPQWENQNFLAKQMQGDQYDAILRGTYAQCRLSAQDNTNQHLAPVVSCSNLEQRYGGGSIESIMQCQKAQEQRPAERERLFRDLFFGCMASQGWMLIAK